MSKAYSLLILALVSLLLMVGLYSTVVYTLILLVLEMNLRSLSRTPAGECNSAATLKACANESILADRSPISRVKFK